VRADVIPYRLLEAARLLLASSPMLPVVTRTRPHRLVGTLTVEDVHRAYGIAPPPPKSDGAGG
jgi:hypothetical protein